MTYPTLLLSQVPATLYREKGMMGAPYQKKTVVLSLHETISEADPQPKPVVLGKLTINLSDYADHEEESDMQVPVQVSRVLTSAMGSEAPCLRVRIKCVGKKLSKEAAAEQRSW